MHSTKNACCRVHHWTDRLFTFTTTRDPALRFSNGHFTMIGLRVNDKPLLRAYSIVSANYEEHLEFLSIKVRRRPADLAAAAHPGRATPSSSAASPPARC